MLSRTTTAGAPAQPETDVSDRAVRALLTCGVAAGPLFVLTIAAQSLVRDGYDPASHPLSMLALGGHGWIQTANFLLAGALVLASAVGLRRALTPASTGRAWGTALIGVYGASLVWAGVFPTDPAEGFPSGTPGGPAADISWHGTLHNLSPVGMGLALGIACLVFARRFAQQDRTGWMIYSAAAPIAYFALSSAAMATGNFLLMTIGGAVVWTWASALCLRFLTARSARI